MDRIYEDTKFLMKKYGITANKKLGQNFLIDENVIDTIANASEISKEDFVIEIGPGLGTLTDKLLQKAGKVVAIELDERMITILKDRFFMYDNFEIINEDVLKVDLEKLIKENKENLKLKNAKIVANLPYYITTPIIMKLLEEKLDIESITVMIQREVADRLTAIPGEKESGAITYTVYYYATSEEVLTVPNNSFIPEPEVESEVIRLDLRKEPPIKIKDEKKFFALIKAAFMQRRKTFLNAIGNSGLDISKEKMEQILQELNIDTKIRGEALTIEQFAKIVERI
ncbi:MAG: 16S rRNA (adenine(1518)-N(6)/adenine(1519)-N(6))-dimethyltransferase RsmA [Clostridia bacterium]|nr:16S rRNA (adenine(1518)-N(6)/adenine(1519)-N(6))-dimethyltransferase RsmA [Clostridia bacterium]